MAGCTDARLLAQAPNPEKHAKSLTYAGCADGTKSQADGLRSRTTCKGFPVAHRPGRSAGRDKTSVAHLELQA